VARSISFDQIADEYDESRGGTARGETMADLLEGHLDRSGVVGEIGIGTGLVAAALAGRGVDLVGVDLAPAMLQRALARLPGRVGNADAGRLPFAPGAFSSVYLVWVLHVVGDPRAVLDECARVVRPGGTVAVVPAHTWHDPDDPVDQLVSRLAVLRPEQPTLADVERWMVDAGLTGITIEHDEEETTEIPSEIADGLERRVWSSLWDLDDERFAALVQPVIDAVRALPDQDLPHVRRRRNHVVVGTVPI